MRVLGIMGSPRKDGNTEFLLARALEEAEKNGTQTHHVSLADRRIEPCNVCRACDKEPSCPKNDDMSDIYQELIKADGIIVSSPVYFGNVSGQLKSMMDRTLIFRRGDRRMLRNKVGAAIAVGGIRSGGQEIVCEAIHAWMLAHDMIVVGDGSHYGGTGCGSYDLHTASTDNLGMESCRNVGKRIAEVLKLLRETRS